MERMITGEVVQTIIERRNREIHKGDCGRILIAAGSPGMAGAAVLCGRAALRAGAGLVRLAIPEELFPIVQIGVPEATCTQRGLLKRADLRQFDAVAAGPGLGESKESIAFIEDLLRSYDGRLVLDADALNIVAHNDLFGLMRARKGETIITPHPGEARRLLGDEEYERLSRGEAVQRPADGPKRKVNEKLAGRIQIARGLAAKTGAIALLKGAGTVVATPEGEAYINTTGNPGMATGGSGDVLTGIIVSLMGQKRPSGELLTALEAAVAGVYIHGLAGDLAAVRLGEYGLIAGDLAEYTAYAMKKILEDAEG